MWIHLSMITGEQFWKDIKQLAPNADSFISIKLLGTHMGYMPIYVSEEKAIKDWPESEEIMKVKL